jgi:hypothetical protein
LGFLASISKKLAKVGTPQSIENVRAPETSDSIVVPHKGIPSDVLHLLWFRDGPLKNIPDEEFNKNTINIGGYSLHISFKGAFEPSAISMKDVIRKPANPENVERPPYYPEYAQIAPEQRWMYLNWLKNVDSDINIGYVFVFYYGLERHLFFGDYDSAFNMVLRLRSVHKNSSFLSYSSTAIILSCMLHNRADMFLRFLNTVSDVHELYVSPLYLIAKRGLGMKLVAPEIVSLAGSVDFRPRTYIYDQREVFQTHLQSLLQKTNEHGALDLKEFSPDECPTRKIIVAANISLPPEQRSIEVPDISRHPQFRRIVLELLQQTHENVKQELRRVRKDGGLVPVKDIVVQNPAREPDPVYRGGLLFEAMDVHMFDRNLRCFNESSCPYCGKPLTKRPARKGKCSQCGNTILGKTSVFTGERLHLEFAGQYEGIELVYDHGREGSHRAVPFLGRRSTNASSLSHADVVVLDKRKKPKRFVRISMPIFSSTSMNSMLISGTAGSGQRASPIELIWKLTQDY